MKNDYLHKLSVAIVPPVYSGLTRLLFWSCRIDELNVHYWNECKATGQFIAAFWHYGIYYIIHKSRGLPWVAMVSASSDGEYVARVLKRMGYEIVRGSKGKGKAGLTALKGMIGWVRKGKNAAIVADGSKGPEFKAQAGAILLASRTGAPILPMAWSTNRYWATGSWDRSVVPKPFARIIMGYEEPISVPSDINADDAERYRLDLEQRMNNLYSELWGKFGREGH